MIHDNNNFIISTNLTTHKTCRPTLFIKWSLACSKDPHELFCAGITQPYSSYTALGFLTRQVNTAQQSPLHRISNYSFAYCANKFKFQPIFSWVRWGILLLLVIKNGLIIWESGNWNLFEITFSPTETCTINVGHTKLSWWRATLCTQVSWLFQMKTTPRHKAYTCTWF